jgi:hypothetical protein
MRTVFRNSEIPGRIYTFQPFLSTGKLPNGTRVWSGHRGPAVVFGFLPPKFHASVRKAVYVVYSYDTPIAWITETEDDGPEPYWYHVPDVGYSPTTGQHQYAVLEAWQAAARGGRMVRGSRREIVRVPGNAVVYGRERRVRSGGLDGRLPGYDDSELTRPSQTTPGWLYDDSGRIPPWHRRSAYEDTGADAAHMDGGPPSGWTGHPSHP